MVVATVLLPAYFRGQIFTAYQVLQDRFGGPTRTTASLLFLVARSLGDGLRLFLAATVLKHLTGWSIEAAIVAVAAITVVYTFLGGMKAVIWTDVIQFSVYILGALVALMILAGKLPGGWTELIETARAAGKFRVLDFSLRPDPALHLLGRPDRRDGAEHGDPRGRPDDGPALPLGPIAAAGGHGAGGQRLRHPGPVRPVPLHRRQPVGVLPGVPSVDGRGLGRRRVRQLRRGVHATSSSTTCRPACSAW